MDVSKFQEARLIPVTGLKGDLDQERRTTSAFLAVLVAVPEFARAILEILGAPVGKVSCFVEPEFEFEGRKIRPDGLIVVERGKTKWATLVEVKTHKNNLQVDQLENYLQICQEHGVPSLLTISNQAVNLTGQHPTEGIDPKKLKKVDMTHLSWVRILTRALMQKEHLGVSDPDQSWILGELIRFLQHPASGALEFVDMGDVWVTVRQATLDSTLTPKDPNIIEVLRNYQALIRFAAFRLSVKLGVEAEEVVPNLVKTDPKKFENDLVMNFIAGGKLSGEIRIPQTISNISVTADLRAGLIECGIYVASPTEGKSLTRINWMLRQIKEAPGTVRIETKIKRAGKGSPVVMLLKEAVEHPEKLLPSDDREILGFTLTVMHKMGNKRNDGQGSFIESVLTAIEICYQSLLENIKPWAPKVPKLPVPSLSIDESPFDPEGVDSQKLGNPESMPIMVDESSFDSVDMDKG